MSQPPALAEMAPVALPARKRSGARVALRAAAPKPTEHEISSDQAQVVPFEAPSSAETPEAAPEETTTPLDQETPPSPEPENEAMEPVAEPSEPPMVETGFCWAQTKTSAAGLVKITEALAVQPAPSVTVTK